MIRPATSAIYRPSFRISRASTSRRAALAKLRNLDIEALPKASAGTRLGPPVAGTRNFIAIGLNYADHAKETGQELPSEPILFNKAPTAISGPYDDVMYPKNSNRMDWECEIAFVIGARARYVEAKDWANYVAGYCICNDVSERRFQSKRGGQWVKGQVGRNIRSARALARHAR